MLPGDLLFAAHREVLLPSGTKVVDPRFVIAHRANSARASLALLDNLPLRRFAPPPHEWGGTATPPHKWGGQPAASFPMNGEDNLPLRRFAPPPHEWGGLGRTTCGDTSREWAGQPAPPALRATSP